MSGLNRDEFKGRITLYSVVGCTSCAKVKSILSEMGIPFYDIDLARFSEERKTMFELAGSRVVPQLFFNEKHIGGYHELKKLLVSGDFDSLLRDVLENEPPQNTPFLPEELLHQEDTTKMVPISELTGCNCGDEECNIFDDGSDSDEDNKGDEAAANKEGSHHIRRRTRTAYRNDDEYAGVANEIRFQSGIAKTKISFPLKKHQHSFSGQDLVSYLVERKAKSKEEAVRIGEQLMKRNFIHHIMHEKNFEANAQLYAFLDDSNKKALNIKPGELPSREQKPVIMLAVEVRRAILDLYAEFLVSNGGAVRYATIGASPKFQLYVQLSEELQRAVIGDLTREQTLSFAINTYNALVIHAFVIHGVPASIFKRYLFYGSACYLIGGYYFTLNDIESGILRANRKPVGTFTVPFRKNDPRVQYALKECEPRIHFALNCGAQSCPPIRTYSAEKIDQELNIATQGFLDVEDGVKLDMDKREILPSKIFQWYKVDFGGSNDSVVSWIVSHMAPGEKCDKITELFASKKYKVKYQSYNWGLNNA